MTSPADPRETVALLTAMRDDAVRNGDHKAAAELDLAIEAMVSRG